MLLTTAATHQTRYVLLLFNVYHLSELVFPSFQAGASASAEVAHVQHLLCCSLPHLASKTAQGAAPPPHGAWSACLHISAACLAQLSPEAWRQGAAEDHLRAVAAAPASCATHLAGVLASFMRTSAQLPTATSCAVLRAVANSAMAAQGGAPDDPEAPHPWSTPLDKAIWIAETLQLVLEQSAPSATRNAAAAACFASVGGVLSQALGGLSWRSSSDAQAAATLIAPWVAFLPHLEEGVGGMQDPAAAGEGSDAPADDGEWGGFLAESAAARAGANSAVAEEHLALPGEWQALFRAAVAGVARLLPGVPSAVPWRDAAEVVLLVLRLGLHGALQARFVRGALSAALEQALAGEGGGEGAATPPSRSVQVAIISLLHRSIGSGSLQLGPLGGAADAVSAAMPQDASPPPTGLQGHGEMHAQLKTLLFAAAAMQHAAQLVAEGVARGAVPCDPLHSASEARSLQQRVAGIASDWRRRGPALAALCKEQLAATAAVPSADQGSVRVPAGSDSDSEDDEGGVSADKGGAAAGAAAAGADSDDAKCRQRERLMVEQTLEMVAAASGGVGGVHRATKALASAAAASSAGGGRGSSKAD